MNNYLSFMHLACRFIEIRYAYVFMLCCLYTAHVLIISLSYIYINTHTYTLHLTHMNKGSVDFEVYDWNEDGKVDFLGKSSVKLRDMTINELSLLQLPLKSKIPYYHAVYTHRIYIHAHTIAT